MPVNNAATSIKKGIDTPRESTCALCANNLFRRQSNMIAEVFRPCGEHCLVVLMTELPDLDLLAVGGLQSFVRRCQPAI